MAFTAKKSLCIFYTIIVNKWMEFHRANLFSDCITGMRLNTTGIAQYSHA